MQRGITASHAPGWTDGAALAVQRWVQYLTTHRRDRSVAAQLGVILSAAIEVEMFMKPLRLGLIDDAAARAVLLWHAARLADITSPRQRFKRCQNIAKVLCDRTRGMEPDELSISPVSSKTGTFRRWLTDDPAHERPRPLPRTFRLWKSLRRWPVAHLRGPAEMCDRPTPQAFPQAEGPGQGAGTLMCRIIGEPPAECPGLATDGAYR